MSAYTEADVQAAALAAFSFEQCDRRQQLDVEGNWESRLNDRDRQEYRDLTRAVLDAVAPAIAARTLREAADPDEIDDIEGAPLRDADGSTLLWLHQPRQISEWLRDRADEIERTP